MTLEKDCLDSSNMVSLLFVDGVLTPREINEMSCILNSQKITLNTYVKPNTTQNGIEDFFAEIYLTLSSNLIGTMFLGVITNGIYDIVKKFIMYLCKCIKNKKTAKITTAKTTVSIPKIFFNIENSKIIIPTDLSEKEFSIYLNKLFDFLKSINTNNELYVYYNKDTMKFDIHTKEELIKKMIIKK